MLKVIFSVGDSASNDVVKVVANIPVILTLQFLATIQCTLSVNDR
jgi:hypothetical protein